MLAVRQNITNKRWAFWAPTTAYHTSPFAWQTYSPTFIRVRRNNQSGGITKPHTVFKCHIAGREGQGRPKTRDRGRQKCTTPRIRWSSPTQLLIWPSSAYQRRSDGIPSFPKGMVVHGRVGGLFGVMELRRRPDGFSRS
ncbi:hypothetical protein F4802DRAFT_552941 [Xylaria palmicola]|nr:hypothetical protein F4802DRAFT_552941 [Xylaria palmicola]